MFNEGGSLLEVLGRLHGLDVASSKQIQSIV
jgi:hypothetical protein